MFKCSEFEVFYEINGSLESIKIIIDPDIKVT